RRRDRASAASGSSTRASPASRPRGSRGRREMSASASAQATHGRSEGGLGPAFAAARARWGVVVLLFALAGVAWWSTAKRMRGMDEGPGTDLGALGWFLGVWLVLMAAMMFPSVSPTIALYARMARRRGLI